MRLKSGLMVTLLLISMIGQGQSKDEIEDRKEFRVGISERKAPKKKIEDRQAIEDRFRKWCKKNIKDRLESEEGITDRKRYGPKKKIEDRQEEFEEPMPILDRKSSRHPKKIADRQRGTLWL